MQLEVQLGRIHAVGPRLAEPTEFVLRLQDREPQAWEELFNGWFPKIYAYALHTTADPSTAQDVASETFARAFRDIHRFGSRGSAIGAWLYTIAHHRVVDLQRQRAHTRLIGLGAAENIAELSDSEPDQLDEATSQQLLLAVQELPPDQRAVVLLRFYGRLSGQETADILGKSHGAVRQLQFRALRNLRTILTVSPDIPRGTKGDNA